MIKELVGPVLDIHGGGSDLIFPHHENELAQSQVNKELSLSVMYSALCRHICLYSICVLLMVNTVMSLDELSIQGQVL